MMEFFRVQVRVRSPALNLLFFSQTQFSVAPPQSTLIPKWPPTFWVLESPLVPGILFKFIAYGAVDSGMNPSRVKPMTLKLIFTASLLDAQH